MHTCTHRASWCLSSIIGVYSRQVQLKMRAVTAYVFYLLLILKCAQESLALTLMLTSTPKCFEMDKARDIPLTFLYEALEENSNPFELSLYYGSGARNDMQVMKKSLLERKGEVKYVTDNDGIYTFCASQSSKEESDHPARLKIIVHYGYDVSHSGTVMTEGSNEHHYDVVNRNLQILNDMIDLTMTEADYQKVRELDHHIDTLAMNSAAIWWPFCQILMLIGIAFFQMHHLKGFFSRITRGFGS